MSNSKQQVDDFVMELSFLKLINRYIMSDNTARAPSSGTGPRTK